MHARFTQRVKRAVNRLYEYARVHVRPRRVSVDQDRAEVGPRPRASRAYTCNFDVAIVRRPRRLTSL